MNSATKNAIIYEDNARADDHERDCHDYDARMEAFKAGRVSYGAARRGGPDYAFEMRESANPVHAAVAGWARAQAAALVRQIAVEPLNRGTGSRYEEEAA